ncbi:BTAD domain-containing putative transcriptional regulator [Actinoplanes sp. NPDC049681]|uniref:BTAD domain-containing putative transcriptional regulator n=1 Tax=Actinoplanes sp. NPDC049681 TaxID=3363905 RepID=UPI0037AAD849
MPEVFHGDLRVSLLGPVRAWRDERELALGPARQRTVFAVLAANANRPIGRDELIKAVWGAAAPDRAVGNLYTYISGLRRRLEAADGADADVLTWGPDGYALRLTDGASDLEEFQRLRAEAAELLAAGDRVAAVDRLEEALGLWQGDAYAGLTGQFVEVDRQRLTELRLTTVELRVRTLLDLGGDDDLVAELTELVREHPLYEPAHELLMLALQRTGRLAEALEAFRDARRTLMSELSVEPGPALSRLHRRLLSDPADQPVTVSPGHGSTTGTGGHPFVGRDAELRLLRGLVDDVARGVGGGIWIDGEPGIGKSELLAVALRDAPRLGCHLARGVAVELGQHVPLQVITRALGLDGARSPLAPPGDDAGPEVATDRLVAYVRSACAVAPLIVVIDDMQWADDATMLVWERLAAATRRLPLLLVAATRPEPNGRILSRLRRGVEARMGHVLTLQPLRADDIVTLIGQIVEAEPGSSLRALTPRTAGNPLFARELVTALVRQGAVHVVDGVADIDPDAAAEAPQSLIAAVRATLDFLRRDTQEVLQFAALLGMEFAVEDVAAVSGRSPAGLMTCLDEAVSANVVVDAGKNLAFRHPYLRQALSDRVPSALRAVMHRHAAESLARGGSPATRVAEQLTAETPVVDAWVVSWLAGNHADVVRRAPQLAALLLHRVLATDVPDPAQRATLLPALTRALFRQEQQPIHEARQALDVATDAVDRAEMRYLLATMHFQRGESAAAAALLQDAVHDSTVPDLWRTRHRVLLASVRRGTLDDLDRVEQRATELYAEAVAAGQQYESAYAQQTLWQVHSMRRDHRRALEHIDRALTIVRDPGLAWMRLDLLDNRIFALQNLDLLDEAHQTLHDAAQFALRHRTTGLPLSAAIHYYWLGRWDEALAEINSVTADVPTTTFQGIREPGAMTMLLHGVAALIAAHRDAPETAAAHLEAGESRPASLAERECCDFSMVAQSLLAQREDRPEEALSVLAPLLRPAFAPMMLRHQWLPDMMRLALAEGRRDLAEQAMEVCAGEAAKETVPARAAAAADRCRALMTGDPGPAMSAAQRYRTVGRTLELAAALEDAAELLARRGQFEAALDAGRESIERYGQMSATFDAGRAHRRLTAAGIPLAIDCKEWPAA